MDKETLRMQMLSGVITESEYKAKLEKNKKPLNENFVGMGMVGNIFDREKTDYELAFEHFTKGTSLNETEDIDEAHPLEGGPGYMTKHHAGVLAQLISDLEAEEPSDANLETYNETLSSLKAALEATKAKYKEETGKDL